MERSTSGNSHSRREVLSRDCSILGHTLCCDVEDTHAPQPPKQMIQSFPEGNDLASHGASHFAECAPVEAQHRIAQENAKKIDHEKARTRWQRAFKHQTAPESVWNLNIEGSDHPPIIIVRALTSHGVRQSRVRAPILQCHLSKEPSISTAIIDAIAWLEHPEQCDNPISTWQDAARIFEDPSRITEGKDVEIIANARRTARYLLEGKNLGDVDGGGTVVAGGGEA